MYSQAACRGLSSTLMAPRSGAAILAHAGAFPLVHEGGVKLPCQHASPGVPHYCRLVRGANKTITLVQMDTCCTLVVYTLHLHAASLLKGLFAGLMAD